MSHVYVIGDVHGCYYTMMALMDRVGPGAADTVVFLGDLINKGPYSKKVVDQMIEWKEKGFKVTSLVGNHELKMLNMIGNENVSELDLYWKLYSARGAYEEFFSEEYEIPKQYLSFFKGLKPYIETDNHLLVHAGVDFSLSAPFEDLKSLTTIRDWAENYAPSVVNGKTIVHGHQNCTVMQAQKAVDSGAKVIPLDTGCVYYGKKQGMGYLTAFSLSDEKLYHQINVEGFD